MMIVMKKEVECPKLIQGGMGIGVSNWKLARAVSMMGQLGVVSGTFLDTLFARRLQDGDVGGHMRFACEHFPNLALANRIFERYYIEGGKAPEAPYRNVPMFTTSPSRELLELTVLANFAEVFLAKQGHEGVVGINLLEAIQMPILPSLYGAMLAGVDYVLMGAGIPKAIPGVLDSLSLCEDVSYKIDVEQEKENASDFFVNFSPREILPFVESLKRPKFIAIVSSHALAINLARKASGKVDGFVIENHTAGGHNAPPRGAMVLDDNGEPVYGERDNANLDEIIKLGLPFWLAGSYASPEKLKDALATGATGIQVGTAFAYCDESGITPQIKEKMLEAISEGKVDVFTDPDASACGYPFKIVQLEKSLSDEHVFESRPRVCDLGYLRKAYKKSDGSLGYRCPGEPVDKYVGKGGCVEDTEGRMCLCNGLAATIGIPQSRSRNYVEPPLVTSGKSILELTRFMKPGKLSYSAKDVVENILLQ